MTTDRRTFLLSAACAGLGAPLARSLAPTSHGSRRKLSVLMIGGTRFLGPAIVDAALAQGHEVTLFNRGQSNPELYPGLEKLVGDRNNDLQLEQLKGRKWDVVIDTCGYFPRQVDKLTAVLEANVGHYIFVSTLSVFQPPTDASVDPLHEDAALVQISEEEAKLAQTVTGRNYGALKAMCEARAEAAMPGKTTNVRPGLIVGPRDTSDRFTYWPVRVSRGGEVLAPGDGQKGVQFIDVRDLGEWIVRIAESKTFGVYNAVGFESRVTLEELLHGCKIVLGGNATFTWVNEGFLQSQSVEPWGGQHSLPMWDPVERPPFGNTKALAAGMTLRPIGDTIRATVDWVKESGHLLRQAGMPADAERHVLEAWHAQLKQQSGKK